MYLVFSISFVIIIILIIYLIYIIYKFICPLEVVEDSLKYQWIKGLDIKRRYNDDSPPIYPNGWTAVLESSNLGNNEVKSIFAVGKDLIVFRGSSGVCYTFDAYCPHLGANLGVGGTILGETIQCPFHGWTFDSSGKCINVPGNAGTINTEIKKYETMEINGYICVWYHSFGNSPDWYPKMFEQIHQDDYIFRGKSVNIINCHIQEIFENLADFQHIGPVHSAPEFLGNLYHKPKYYDSVLKIIHYESTPEWKVGTDFKKHTCTLRSRTDLKIVGFTVMVFNASIEIMGLTLGHFSFEICTFWGKYQFHSTQALIQQGDFNIYMINKYYSRKGLISNYLARFLTSGYSFMAQRDAIIWSNKKYKKRALFAKNEENLVEYRRWCKQFY